LTLRTGLDTVSAETISGLPILRLSHFCAAAALVLALTSPAFAETWTVKREWVSAHENFLASEALQGRGSATRDEAIAAAYVASQFEGFGLKPAPGMTGYLQTAWVIQPRLEGPVSLTVGGQTVGDAQLLSSSGNNVSGTIKVFTGEDIKTMPAGDIVMAIPTAKLPLPSLTRAARAKGAKLIILRENEDTTKYWESGGKTTNMSAYLESDPPATPRMAIAVLPAATYDRLAKDGAQAALTLPEVIKARSITTNAIGYLKGSDPAAGTILYTAHLDALGVKGDTIIYGANDDASGTTAVLEIARALASGKKPKRSILFVAYGAEELGLLGSLYFAKNSPVPLKEIIANLEFEMIGAQDPKLPANTLMMTGFERSDFGETMKAQGAQITTDPYPEHHFFERSDNYQLALQGIVAHTVSGWATTPDYHSPKDTVANLNIDFMTSAIQSLIAPARWLANSTYVPQWKPGGKPVAK
jgi:aminopeptidase YwaD